MSPRGELTGHWRFQHVAIRLLDGLKVALDGSSA